MTIYKRLIILLMVLVIGFGTIAFQSPDSKYFEIARNLDIFATLFKEVNAYYVDEIDPEELIGTGINAMLASLDPYTSYIPEEHLEDYKTITTGVYGGIGALVGNIDDRTVVTMLYEGYGAHNAGVKIGDEILEIDGVPVKGSQTQNTTELLKGKPGTEITLRVKRFGQDDVLSFRFQRENIHIPNVPFYKKIGPDVGYIRLSDFTTGASREVQQVVKKLKSNGAKKLVLDLRSNPGGLLSEAINIANLFIPKGEEIVSTKGKNQDWNKTYKGLNQPIDEQIPIVVLINNMSASASEIVAGVIQDYDRGVLMGRRTFGKGLVQSTRQLTYNVQLKITTAKYYIPSRRCIQAIDYAARNPDGSVSHIPDSLKVEFRTRNNRKVYDGGGLIPDISIEGVEWNDVVVNLLQSGMVFDYANEYYLKNREIPPMNQFSLTDSEYNNFISWLDKKDYSYVTNLEKSVQNLITVAKEESASKEVENKLEEINNKLTTVKSKRFITYKLQIKRLLQQEILSRYYLYKGDIEASLIDDNDLLAAIDLLSDKSKYDSILAK